MFLLTSIKMNREMAESNYHKNKNKYETHPTMVHPNFLSGLGAVLSIFLSSVGASWASVPAGLWAIHNAPTNHMKEGDGTTNGNHGNKKCMLRSCFFSFAPIIIAGVLAIYGTIVAVLIISKVATTNPDDTTIMTMTAGYRSLTAGLVVGLACLASGGGMANLIWNVNQSHGYVSSLNTNRVDPQITEQHQPLLASRREASTNTICNARFLMVMVFLEAIALYGLILALLILWA
jgi:F0F1-type ATP synthase membrane subunit c/vacuolar-type H+-ATPase subunit K